MGNFRIEIEATGGHGDCRDVKQGETLDPAAYPEHSVDAVAWDAVAALKAKGANVISARLIHWPETPSEVVDDVLNSKRLHGSF
jgi:hypothetical protein